MLTVTTAWGVCTGLICLIGFWLIFSRSVTLAMGVAVILSFLVPSWLEISLFGLDVGVRTMVAGVFLFLFALLSPREIPSRIVVIDVVMLAIVIHHAMSDAYHDIPWATSALMAYAEWGFPYLAGRFAARRTENLGTLARTVSIAVIILGALGAVEMLMRVNLWEAIGGPRPDDGVPHDLSRLGFKRAYGPTTHPMFLGLMMLVLIPWGIALIWWKERNSDVSLGIVGQIANFVGLVSNVSRSSVLGGGFFYVVLTMAWNRVTRWILVGMFLLGAFVHFNYSAQLVTFFEDLVGEKQHENAFVLDGKHVSVSSANLRNLQLKVMWPAMKEAGWYGYGTKALSTLPPDVPYLPANEKTRNALKYVDNAYLMYGLRFGWTGAILFTVLLLSVIWTGYSMSDDRSVRILTNAISAMTIVLALNLITVFFAYEAAFAGLWTFGVLAGIKSSQRS